MIEDVKNLMAQAVKGQKASVVLPTVSVRLEASGEVTGITVAGKNLDLIKKVVKEIQKQKGV